MRSEEVRHRRDLSRATRGDRKQFTPTRQGDTTLVVKKEKTCQVATTPTSPSQKPRSSVRLVGLDQRDVTDNATCVRRWDPELDPTVHYRTTEELEIRVEAKESYTVAP